MNTLLNIASIQFNDISIDELINIINTYIKNNDKLTIGYINVYICNYTRHHPDFENLLNKFSLVHPDGIGIYIASKILYGKKGLSERFTGTDLYNKLFYGKQGFKYFLYGGFDNCSNSIKNSISNTVSWNANIVGSIYTPKDTNWDIESINKSGADILFVALGTPFQEEWINENKDKLKVPVIIAIGSGLYFLLGVINRAPMWMQKVGLEWMFRLIQEPGRLWRRYIFGIPVFVFNIIILKLKLMFKKEST